MSDSLYAGKSSQTDLDSKQEDPVWPEISTGASLLLAWQLKGRRVLVVGGGNVAADRLRSVLPTGANVCLICPAEGMGEEVKYRVHTEAERWSIDWRDRAFEDGDILNETWDMVLTALDDPSLSSHIHSLCKDKRINVNVADVPPLCDFYFGSVIRRGPLQIMVSTNGKGPRLANRIRRGVEESLPADGVVEKAIENTGRLRSKLRGQSGGKDKESVQKRMEWMVDVSDAWTLHELASMTEQEEQMILAEYQDGYAPSCSTVRRNYWRRAACPWWWLNALNPWLWTSGQQQWNARITERRSKCPVFKAKKNVGGFRLDSSTLLFSTFTVGVGLGAILALTLPKNLVKR